MPYVTIPKPPRRPKQMSLEQLLLSQIDVFSAPTPPRISDRKLGTITRFYPSTPERLARTANPDYLLQVLKDFAAKHAGLYQQDRQSLYNTFFIPKKSGSIWRIGAPKDDFRRIDAPKGELSSAQRELREIFEQRFYALQHTSAYAYVAGRSTVDAVKRHQANESKWFLKVDFSNFFGSTTPAFVLSQLRQIFPFSEIMNDAEGVAVVSKALDLCFLNGGLPQGTPISPMLTNLMMIPVDHALAKLLHQRRMVYTRYADDLLISCQKSFLYKDVVREIEEILKSFSAPLRIKPEKTRYGSSAGANWNLGVMLNKDNKITIGWKNVDRFKAMCHSYITDRLKGVRWDRTSVQQFVGLISYYMMVEKTYIQHIIVHYNQKHHVNMMAMLKEDLSSV